MGVPKVTDKQIKRRKSIEKQTQNQLHPVNIIEMMHLRMCPSQNDKKHQFNRKCWKLKKHTQKV